MKYLEFTIYILFALSAISCSQSEPFITIDKYPKFKLVNINEEKKEIALQLTNSQGRVEYIKELHYISREFPEIEESFYTRFCGDNVLVVVIKQLINTGVSTGYNYWDMIISPENGDLIEMLERGKMIDKEAGEIISNDQEATIAMLKSGVQSAKFCKK